MAFNKLLSQYRQLELVTKNMLAIATQAKWDQLLELQIEYDNAAVFISKTDTNAVYNQISLSEQAEINALIEKIISNQDQLEQIITLQKIEVADMLAKEISTKKQIISYNNISTMS